MTTQGCCFVYTIQEMLLVAFAIGLTGALTPGPTLIATIKASVEYGWYAGPLITAGHCLVEFVVFVLILVGLITVAGQYSWVIAAFGGIALVIFGVMTILGSRSMSLSGTTGGLRGIPGHIRPVVLFCCNFPVKGKRTGQ